ncbi:hypothetical protein HHK36_000045 [Tetracentron sinense]|uniref:Uncharacterized protein n=1 Tax=Tetracentron sinense TaxID=13715 RepID=A0A834ZRK1_TETSI|nr:hypothetical protein HHK36_000045 [Tetracentron sinense]
MHVSPDTEIRSTGSTALYRVEAMVGSNGKPANRTIVFRFVGILPTLGSSGRIDAIDPLKLQVASSTTMYYSFCLLIEPWNMLQVMVDSM